MRGKARLCESCGDIRDASEYRYTQGGRIIVRTKDVCNDCTALKYRRNKDEFSDAMFNHLSQEWLSKPLLMESCCTQLIPLRTIKIDLHASEVGSQMCPDCKTKYPWGLKPGQQPLVTSSKDRGL